jgi:hypothetical protein
MIRAIIKEGKLWPLDPLPEAWVEGRTVEIDGQVEDDADEIDRWCREVEEAAALTPDDPEDYRRLEAALAEADRVAKEQVRREFGLP